MAGGAISGLRISRDGARRFAICIIDLSLIGLGNASDSGDREVTGTVCGSPVSTASSAASLRL
jgi:hypothetical protein